MILPMNYGYPHTQTPAQPQAEPNPAISPTPPSAHLSPRQEEGRDVRVTETFSDLIRCHALQRARGGRLCRVGTRVDKQLHDAKVATRGGRANRVGPTRAWDRAWKGGMGRGMEKGY